MIVGGLPPRFALVERLGRGVTSVYVVDDHETGERVVLKVPMRHPSPGVIRCLNWEASILSRLDHPGIPKLRGLVEIGGRPSLLIQHFDAVDLDDVFDALATADSYDASTLLPIVASAADALAAVHAAGFVHADVKPANLLALDSGAVLLDFGLAVPVHEFQRGASATYLAPEQVRVGPLTDRTDVYALASILYECIAGDVPFRVHDNDEADALARLKHPPTELRALNEAVPVELSNLVHRALAIEPSDRPSAVEIRDHLRAAMGAGAVADADADPRRPTELTGSSDHSSDRSTV